MDTRRHFLRLSAGVSALGLASCFPALAATAPKILSDKELFSNPYVDIDEWRDFPVRHRYVHGGFRGNDTRFSFYFAPPDKYQGRFFQTLDPSPGDENGAQKRFPNTNPAVTQDVNTIAFAVASGAYLVESNMGSKNMFPTSDRTVSGFRASAAVANYSRVLAAAMYGPHRPYGYVFGASGGSLKTISCIENTDGVWDGAVPYVMGTTLAMPSTFTAQAHALRLLKDKFPAIVDALDPGGSGDMYAGLNDEERGALAEVTKMGFPPAAWFDHKRLAFNYTGIFIGLLDNLLLFDPGYFRDFWRVPGYLGANPPPSLLAARITHQTKVRRVVTGEEARRLGLPLGKASLQVGDVPAALELESLPQKSLLGAAVLVKSGAAAGSRASVAGTRDGLLLISFGQTNFERFKSIKAGDSVEVNNSDYLAAQTYHRHQVPSKEFYAWDQFRRPDGTPIYPQRPRLAGPLFQDYAAGSLQTGRFKGKMIVVQSMMDEGIAPWHADRYRSMVQQAFGSRLDDYYRLWFTEHALHGRVDDLPGHTRAIDYFGIVQQALRDLSAWVEKGRVPAQSTNYRVVDSQIVVPGTAAERMGIQPVVRLTADGHSRADVAVGQAVTFLGEIEIPPGAGELIAARWDFEGAGDYPLAGEITVGGPEGRPATVAASYKFAKPGTYFPALHVTLQRQPDASNFARINNLARVRVVVS